ncbi:hypothetical protein, partial [Actinacidiphila glaucinigra]|uniref:hypothetical protein n=1 Tax=Actinacidiphila glaucinigra TaxID=235986 RepID=UPI0035DFFCCB
MLLALLNGKSLPPPRNCSGTPAHGNAIPFFRGHPAIPGPSSSVENLTDRTALVFSGLLSTTLGERRDVMEIGRNQRINGINTPDTRHRIQQLNVAVQFERRP